MRGKFRTIVESGEAEETEVLCLSLTVHLPAFHFTLGSEYSILIRRGCGNC